ncbi:biotin/lipoyl-containing protein [Paraburkholderia sp. BL10I2N1]|uniref:acetyl-CoA carboxylase biotin carboxyl carrier protein n=1 Tax=Paraburkholderia sp. BL10I2N1 TaxID=1938796 RepID=UPI00105F2F32|nr:biotin/lipoyl-containing protein [Paraburkholderia sp. BL10I2N1]TDN58023.1 acetyl-CoA carboxylase biotin carboxyl carrier protein [Paraburkholderia sp. BL10I2N1]
MGLSHADVRRILDTLDRAEQLESLEIKVGDYLLQARKPGAAPLAAHFTDSSVALSIGASSSGAPSATPKPVSPSDFAAAEAPAQPDAVPEGMTAIRAPMVGTFYLTPKPDAPPFVAVGSDIKVGDTVCLVEVMKMFNSIESTVSGKVHRVVARHGQLVQHDQILMLIDVTRD